MSLEEGDRLVGLIGKIREQEITVCLIELACGSLEINISDHIVALNTGKKLRKGLPREIRSNREVIEAYLEKEYAA